MTSNINQNNVSRAPRGPYQRRKRLRADPDRFMDSHGRECLRVPLDRHGRQHAVVTARDYQAVRDAGAAGTWFLNSDGKGSAYVRTSHAGTLLMPARIITGAGARSVIRYVDGNPQNLLPENIVLHRGRAKRADYDIALGDDADEGGGW